MMFYRILRRKWLVLVAICILVGCYVTAFHFVIHTNTITYGFRARESEQSRLSLSDSFHGKSNDERH